jgi:hypothetical protein
MGDNLTNPGIAVVVAFFFLLFLPALVIAARGRLVLQIAAFLLCCLGAAALLSSVAAAGGLGVSMIVALPVAAGLWFAGLLCALAAWFDAAQERRQHEMTLRLLMNDATGLKKLPHQRDGWFS